MNVLLLDREENLIDYIDIFNPEDEESINADSILTFSTFYKNIEKGYRILYQDRLNEWHEYIIQSAKTKHDSNNDIFIEVYAENSFYETLGDYIEDKRPRNSTATNALSEALAASRWEVGVVENLGLNTTSFYRCSVKDAVQNKIVKVWGGEFSTSIKVEGNKIVSRKVNIFKKRGDDHGKRFVYGKDIHEIEKVVNEEDIITALYGFGKGEEIEETGGHGRRIDFADINNGKKYVENNAARLKYGRNSDKGKVHVFGKIEFDDITDKNELLAKTREELEKASTPKITYNATVEDLAKYGFEYEGVKLGDTVTIIDEELGLRLKARVIKLVKNLDDSNADKVTLGNFVETTNDLFIEAYKKINDFRNKEAIWDSASKKIQDGIDAEFLNNVIDKINTEINNSGGYVYISKDGKGIITYDKPLDQNPTKAIQLMGGSIRIANKKKSDGTWDWRSFGTGDGFVADEIITGILKGGNVKWNLNDGTFLIGESEDNYLLKFDGSTLKFGSGTIGKDNLSESLKKELKGNDGESFRFNLLSNGDFHEDFTKKGPGYYNTPDVWQVRKKEELDRVKIQSTDGQNVLTVDASGSNTVLINQIVNLKKNTKYYMKIMAASRNMWVYYYGSSYSSITSFKESTDTDFKIHSGEFTTEADTNLHGIELDCRSLSKIKWIILSEEPINSAKWYPSQKDLQGKDGKDGKDGSFEDLPPALKAWSGKATEISGEYVFTPELFIGNGAYGDKTGIYVGNRIRTKFQGEWHNIAGMVGMENGEANWMFTHSGDFILGRKPGETIQLGADGRAVIPMIKSNMIETGAITAEKIEAGAITTDFLYPGTNERIILERGYEPGSNDAKSIDATGDAIRLKYNASGYLSVSATGITGYRAGVRKFATAGPFDGVSVADGAVMNIEDPSSIMVVHSDRFWVRCGGSAVLIADDEGVYSSTAKLSSDAKLKENLSKLDDTTVIRKNDNVKFNNLTSDDVFNFLKNTSLFNYNFKGQDKPKFSLVAQLVKGPVRNVIVDYNKINNTYAIDVYNYASIIHAGVQEEIKKRETLEDKVSKLEEELAGIKKLLKERGIE